MQLLLALASSTSSASTSASATTTRLLLALASAIALALVLALGLLLLATTTTTKYGNYLELEQHHDNDIVFVPMAFESMGATGRTFTTFLRLVSEQVHADSKRAQAEFRAEWRKKSEWHYIIQWLSNTLFRFRRIRQNKQDLAIWSKDKANIRFNKGGEAEAIQTNFT